jgi:hypothetical protein
VRAKIPFSAFTRPALAVDPSEITWRKRPGLKAINRLPVRTTREALAPVVAGQG